MRIAVFYDHVAEAAEQTGRPVSELMRECREWGIEGLEFNHDTLIRDGAKLKPLLAETGLKVAEVYLFHDFGRHPDPEAGIRAVDLAADFGAAGLLSVPGFLSVRDAERLTAARRSTAATYAFMDRHKGIGRMTEALDRMTEYAAERGLRVTLEDFDGETSPCAGMLNLRRFLDRVPGLGISFDTGNFAYSREDARVAFEMLADRIVHVHCKDRGIDGRRIRTDRGRWLKPVPVGGGYIPIREIVTCLKAMGYDGWLAAEHFGYPDQREAIRRSAEYLRDLL